MSVAFDLKIKIEFHNEKINLYDAKSMCAQVTPFSTKYSRKPAAFDAPGALKNVKINSF